jgi:hypothetical protein
MSFLGRLLGLPDPAGPEKDGSKDWRPERHGWFGFPTDARDIKENDVGSSSTGHDWSALDPDRPGGWFWTVALMRAGSL